MSVAEVTLEFSGVLRFWREDGGQALIAQLPTGESGDEDGPAVFIRLHGWDASGTHPRLLPLEGRHAHVRVRVRLEGQPGRFRGTRAGGRGGHGGRRSRASD
jgi:hypothetical protein